MWGLALGESTIFSHLGNNQMLHRWHSSSICKTPIIRSMNFDCLKKKHMSFKFLHVRSQFCTCVYNLGFKVYVHSAHPILRKNKNFTSCPILITLTLRMLELLNFCRNDDILLPMPSLQSCLLHTLQVANQNMYRRLLAAWALFCLMIN